MRALHIPSALSWTSFSSRPDLDDDAITPQRLEQARRETESFLSWSDGLTFVQADRITGDIWRAVIEKSGPAASHDGQDKAMLSRRAPSAVELAPVVQA